VDRKELIRQYKDTPRPMGVFRVVHTASGKCLVGTSVDLPSVLNRERAQLRLGGHRNEALQRDWNSFGADAFVFEVLDTLTPPDEPGYDPTGDLQVLEQMWLEKLSPFDERGYNRRPRNAAS
jgi:hypothetical protein